MAAARGPGTIGGGHGAPGTGPDALGATGAIGGPHRRRAVDSPDRFAGLAAALVLGDGRFPAGGHAHSGGSWTGEAHYKALRPVVVSSV